MPSPRVLTVFGSLTSLPSTARAGARLLTTTGSIAAGSLQGGHFDIADHGAEADGVTDDSAAVQAAIDAMGDANGDATCGVVYLPGDHYFANDIIIARPVTVRGATLGQGNGITKATFAAGKGFRCYHTGAPVSAGGRTASHCSFEHLDIITTKITTTAYEGVATARTVGDKRIVDGANWVYLECIKAGTDGGALTDADVPYEPDESTPFTPSTEYRYGNIVRGTTNNDALAANGSNLITTAYFRVTSPAFGSSGTSGATYPTWDTTPGNTTVSGGLTFTAVDATEAWITDGTAVWACKVHAGIFTRTPVVLDRVYIEGATNAGFAGRGNGVYSNLNHSELRHVISRNCGMGIMISGADASQVLAFNCTVENAGSGMPGNGGIGILDAGFLNSTWINCEVANDPTNGGGASFRRTNGGKPSVFVNCYSESYGGSAFVESEFDSTAVLIGGNYGGGITSGSTAAEFDHGNNRGCRYLTTINAGDAGNRLCSVGGVQDGVQAWGVYRFGDSTQTGLNYTTSYGSWPDAWWSFGRADANSQQAWAVPSESNENWPSGQDIDTGTLPFWVTQSRVHVGAHSATVDPPSVGFGAAAPASGYYVQGSVTFNTGATVGQPVGWQCTVTGSPGTWVAMANL